MNEIRDKLWADVYALHFAAGKIWFRCQEEADIAVKAFDRRAQPYSKDAESDSNNTNGLATEAANPLISNDNLAEWTGLEPATPGVTGPCANPATTGEKP